MPATTSSTRINKRGQGGRGAWCLFIHPDASLSTRNDPTLQLCGKQNVWEAQGWSATPSTRHCNQPSCLGILSYVASQRDPSGRSPPVRGSHWSIPCTTTTPPPPPPPPTPPPPPSHRHQRRSPNSTRRRRRRRQRPRRRRRLRRRPNTAYAFPAPRRRSPPAPTSRRRSRARSASGRQGLTLVHFSAQRKHL